MVCLRSPEFNSYHVLLTYNPMPINFHKILILKFFSCVVLNLSASTIVAFTRGNRCVICTSVDTNVIERDRRTDRHCSIDSALDADPEYII